jgi:hypothetical protein
MAIKVNVQRDYLLTEFSVSGDVSEIDQLLRSIKADGKMIILYNGGHVQGINVEQRSKMDEHKSEKVREILSIKDKVL